jgi:hypothetical protein
MGKPSVKLWTESVRRNADAVRTDHNRLSEWLARIVAIPPTWGYSSISARALALPSWHADIERRTASAATRSAKGTRLAAGCGVCPRAEPGSSRNGCLRAFRRGLVWLGSWFSSPPFHCCSTRLLLANVISRQRAKAWRSRSRRWRRPSPYRPAVRIWTIRFWRQCATSHGTNLCPRTSAPPPTRTGRCLSDTARPFRSPTLSP